LAANGSAPSSETEIWNFDLFALLVKKMEPMPTDETCKFRPNNRQTHALLIKGMRIEE
jgi:hypothetical protein